MIETQEDVWKYYCVFGHYICITTNGTVNQFGRAVMGGDTLHVTVHIHGISKSLGTYLTEFGNHAGFLRTGVKNSIIVFPVKNGPWEDASTRLISQSTKWLMDEAQTHPANIYHLPCPGCGAEKLDCETQVKPLVQHLPDNVFVHHSF